MMLREHEASRSKVKNLLDCTADEGEQIVVRVRQQVSCNSIPNNIDINNNVNVKTNKTANYLQLTSSLQWPLKQPVPGTTRQLSWSRNWEGRRP